MVIHLQVKRSLPEGGLEENEIRESILGGVGNRRWVTVAADIFTDFTPHVFVEHFHGVRP